jgi:hypothetical protein
MQLYYCRCREDVKLFRLLLSPYRLVGACNSVQNCTSRRSAEMGGGGANICIVKSRVAVIEEEAHIHPEQ